MSNKPTKYSVTLTVPEDFVKRVVALCRGSLPDDDDFLFLLETGLETLERVASAKTCDCPDCRQKRGEQPSRTAIADFEVVRDQLNRLGETSECGQVRYENVTLALSESSLVFMSFLDRLYEAQGRGGLRLVQPGIDIDRPADFEGASRYLSHMVVALLDSEFADFAAGKHSLLFPPRPAAAEEPTLH